MSLVTMDIFESISNFFNSPYFRFSIKATLYFFIVLWVVFIIWTYRDAKRRGSYPLFWSAVVLFFSLLGLFVYLILRPPEFLDDVRERELEIKRKEFLLRKEMQTCVACLRPIESDFLVCPYCYKKLKKTCPTCSRALKLEWSVCPYCQTTL